MSADNWPTFRERDEEEDIAEKQQCQCHFEMPGSCPGPANCPMCQPENEE